MNTLSNSNIDDTEEENIGDYFNQGYKEVYNKLSSIDI